MCNFLKTPTKLLHRQLPSGATRLQTVYGFRPTARRRGKHCGTPQLIPARQLVSFHASRQNPEKLRIIPLFFLYINLLHPHLHVLLSLHLKTCNFLCWDINYKTTKPPFPAPHGPRLFARVTVLFHRNSPAAKGGFRRCLWGAISIRYT